MKKPLDFSKLPIGTEVCCSIFGNGVITDIELQGAYPVVIRFGNGEDEDHYFLKTGQYIESFPITLRLDHDRFKIGEPFPDIEYETVDHGLKRGDLCAVWDDDGKINPVIVAFGGEHPDGDLIDMNSITWDNWVRLPDDVAAEIKNGCERL